MKNRSQTLKSFSLIAMLVPFFAFGADREDVDPEAALSSSQEMTMQEMQDKKVQHGASGYIFDRYPTLYLPSSAHILAGVSAKGDEIELEDGSIWKISPYDSSKAFDWLRQLQLSDKIEIPLVPLVIFQNTSWFSNYAFRIVNSKDNSSIVANLFQGPFKGGEHSRYITEIDYSQGLIMLSDASHWEINPSDRGNLFEWALSEPVIIGQNADYDASWSPYWEGLLINVRKTKKILRAHQY